MKGIYEFYKDYGRSGELEGAFIADSTDVEKAIGKYIYMGECLGKHSEVALNLEYGDIVLKTSDQSFIALFEEIMGKGWSTGHNPLEHLPDEEEDDEELDDDLIYENISND